MLGVITRAKKECIFPKQQIDVLSPQKQTLFFVPCIVVRNQQTKHQKCLSLLLYTRDNTHLIFQSDNLQQFSLVHPKCIAPSYKTHWILYTNPDFTQAQGKSIRVLNLQNCGHQQLQSMNKHIHLFIFFVKQSH